jgi:hypothetical protein
MYSFLKRKPRTARVSIRTESQIRTESRIDSSIGGRCIGCKCNVASSKVNAQKHRDSKKHQDGVKKSKKLDENGAKIESEIHAYFEKNSSDTHGVLGMERVPVDVSVSASKESREFFVCQ